MSKVRVNSINPFSGGNITLGGHAVPSGSDKNLGSETNPWSELYVSTGSINFVNTANNIVASIKAGGESNVNAAIPLGMVFTETAGAFNTTLRGSFSVGRNNRALGTASLTVGLSNTASGNYSYAQGQGNNASGLSSHAEGSSSIASGVGSHAEGSRTIASGINSHAEGERNIASGYNSHAEGYFTTASGGGSHAEGSGTIASGDAAHAEGGNCIASSTATHAEGVQTIASNYGAHSEGYITVASGPYSHAEGAYTTASGLHSHAGGFSTVAAGNFQTVVGMYNTENNTTSLFVVGAGSGSITGYDPVAITRKDGFSVELDNANSRPHIVVPTNTGNPSNPKTGSMYFNPSTNMISIWNGTTWRTASFG